ncbi:hypothetical protein GQ43DRAFT_370585 [Delitschia confertaspora ATCC 74209]|uniref:Dynamin family n=1 Tax=Delitschia confertaspora ATCC 74209 TaxID=1513339 RepID=A0A9P4JLW0_9PLEO|nr:hypothetical protein GQ43DRAFT_370585 [Delitschia confertaspora ATCC 74209]
MADPMLLDKIDKLFASGVGDYISLPQLVVVGDQSSGKSSVLEGLTNLPFPRDSGLCTRFATQITFRRAQASSISVSIIPGQNADETHVEKTRSWSKPNLNKADGSSFATSFAGIMTEVHEIMGLGDKENKGNRGTFSEDVLRLEVCGPDQEHFSVVDVPGIFRKTTEGITTKADRDMVTAMVHRYMENPRSIMLTVIPANVDIATQEILTMAEEVDPEGQRTLGVLTKPDLVDRGAEGPVMELVEGKRHQLSLGWCIVRNLGQKQLEDKSTNRDTKEMEFFRTEKPWSTLDSDRVGIAALRTRLQEILASSIRREFPKVKSEIHKKLAASREELKELGGKRETPAEQSRYLLEMSMRFQEIVSMALGAKYVGSDWFDKHSSLRLVTAVVNRNEKFAAMLAAHGHSYVFEDNNPVQVCVVDKNNDEISVRCCAYPDELEELVSTKETIPREAENNIFGWLKTLYQESRGLELGTFDSSLLAMTMKTQSAHWDSIAKGYIMDIISVTHAFIKSLLQLICPNRQVRDGLMSTLMDSLTQKYSKAIKQTEFLLQVERMETPVTLNHYFNDNLEKSRQKRIQANLSAKTHYETKNGWGSVVKLSDIIQTHAMSNIDHVVRDIHDILKAYYKVARKRFADNVVMQAANFHLVNGPEAPLKLFSPSFVSELSEDQLVEIAGEDAALKRKRAALNKEIADLEAGKKVLS